MLKLVQIDQNTFDLAFDDPALTDTEAALNTLLAVVLYTDAEAPESREPDRYLRRGWWHKKTGNDIWHVRRQPLTPDARKEALFVVENALKKYSDVLSDIVVTDITSRSASPTGVILQITGKHKNREFLRQVTL